MKFWKALFKVTIGTIAPTEKRLAAPSVYAKRAEEVTAPVKKQESKMQDITVPEVAEAVSVKPMEVSASVSLEPKITPRKRVKKQTTENNEIQTLS